MSDTKNTLSNVKDEGSAQAGSSPSLCSVVDETTFNENPDFLNGGSIVIESQDDAYDFHKILQMMLSKSDTGIVLRWSGSRN